MRWSALFLLVLSTQCAGCATYELWTEDVYQRSEDDPIVSTGNEPESLVRALRTEHGVYHIMARLRGGTLVHFVHDPAHPYIREGFAGWPSAFPFMPRGIGLS